MALLTKIINGTLTFVTKKIGNITYLIDKKNYDFIFNITAGTKTIGLQINTGKKVEINWGDGTKQTVTGTGSFINYTHPYSTGGKKYVEINGAINDITRIDIIGSASFKLESDVAKLQKFKNLTFISIYGTVGLYGILDCSQWTNLGTLGLSNNSITQITGISSNTTLTNIQMSNNKLSQSFASFGFENKPNIQTISFGDTTQSVVQNITGDISSVANSTLLNSLLLYNTKISFNGFDTIGIPNLQSFYLRNPVASEITGTISINTAGFIYVLFYVMNASVEFPLASYPIATGSRIINLQSVGGSFIMPSIHKFERISSFVFVGCQNMTGDFPDLENYAFATGTTKTISQFQIVNCPLLNAKDISPTVNSGYDTLQYLQIFQQSQFTISNAIVNNKPLLFKNLIHSMGAYTGNIPSGYNSNQLDQIVQRGTFTGQSIPDYSANTTIKSIDHNYSGLTGYTPQALPLGTTSFSMEGNALTVIAVNQILADFVINLGSRPSSGARVINLRFGINAAPTGQGLIDKAILQGAGWTVVTN